MPWPLSASLALSAAAAARPTDFRTPGEGRVRGCGRVGADFLPCSILRPSSLASSAVSAVRSAGQACVSSYEMCSRAALMSTLTRFSNSGALASSLSSLSRTSFPSCSCSMAVSASLSPSATLSRTVGQKYISSTASCLDSAITSCSTTFFRCERSLVLAPEDAVGPDSSSASICLTSAWSWLSTSNACATTTPQLVGNVVERPSPAGPNKPGRHAASARRGLADGESLATEPGLVAIRPPSPAAHARWPRSTPDSFPAPQRAKPPQIQVELVPAQIKVLAQLIQPLDHQVEDD